MAYVLLGNWNMVELGCEEEEIGDGENSILPTLIKAGVEISCL